MDMNQYIKIILPRKFSQNDPQWKSITLGTSGTIGAYGCLMTDATMTANYFGVKETPITLNEKLKANNGYVNGNLFNWSVFAQLFGLKYSGQSSSIAPLTNEQMSQIKNAIDKGYPVFLRIDTIPATAKLDEHWILAIGYDGDDFIIQDPWDGATKRITSWGVSPQKLIYAWCWYTGRVPQSTSMDDPVMQIRKSERDFLVGRATTAKEVAEYLGIVNPDNADTQLIKNTIGGIKSRETECKTSLAGNNVELSKAKAEIANRVEQVSRLENEVTDALEREKSLQNQLNQAIRSGGQTGGVLQEQLNTLHEDLDKMAKEKGQATSEAAEWKAKYEAASKGIKTESLFDALLMFLKGTKVLK